MSEWSNIIADVIDDRASFTTDPVVNLTRGGEFTAEIEGNLDPLTLSERWLSDDRAKVRLHVTDDSEAANIGLTDLIQFTLYGRTAKFEIVERTKDPASPQTSFLCVEKIAKDK